VRLCFSPRRRKDDEAMVVRMKRSGHSHFDVPKAEEEEEEEEDIQLFRAIV